MALLVACECMWCVCVRVCSSVVVGGVVLRWCCSAVYNWGRSRSQSQVLQSAARRVFVAASAHFI